LVEAWRDIEDHAKELSKRLTGKEAATPSRTWNLLSNSRSEMVLFLAVTARQQAVAQKIKNFLTKWRDVQKRIPLPEMTELLITPQLPAYPKIANDVFMLLLDGKLRNHTEIMKYLKPLAPPPPPPPPPPRRGRGKAVAVAAGASLVASPQFAAKPGRGRKKAAPVVAAAPAPPVAAPVPQAKPKPETKPQAKPPAKSAEPSKPAKAKSKPAKQKSKPAKAKTAAKPRRKKPAARKPPAKKPARKGKKKGKKH